ncbi:MAG: hypothetical protein ACK40O_01215 [Allosphingosinicella sp.]
MVSPQESKAVTLVPLGSEGFYERDGAPLPEPLDVAPVPSDERLPLGEWRGSVVSPEHRYAGNHVEVSSKLVGSPTSVVLKVYQGSKAGELVFSGLAVATGLEQSAHV